jgi:hypothetical protein
MTLTLDTGETLAFGQELASVEKLFSCTATDKELRLSGRAGIDKIINAKNISLEFDSGRLKRIRFSEEYRYLNPLTPYPEEWRNLPPIDNKKISNAISRDELLEYLTVWKKRAESFGMEKVEFNDMTLRQFAVSITCDRYIDMISISMGPTRRTRGGGIWCDSWGFIFSTNTALESTGIKAGLLQSVSVFRDEFNTAARK